MADLCPVLRADPSMQFTHTDWMKAFKHQRDKSNMIIPLPCSGEECSREEVDGSKISFKEALSKADSFKGLCPLLNDCDAHLSLFGATTVTSGDYKGSLPLDALAERVEQLLELNPHFNQDERRHLKNISDKIDILYKTSENELQASAFYTRLGAALRHLPEWFLSTPIPQGSFLDKIAHIWNQFNLWISSDKRPLRYSLTHWRWSALESGNYSKPFGFSCFYGKGLHSAALAYTEKQYNEVFPKIDYSHRVQHRSPIRNLEEPNTHHQITYPEIPPYMSKEDLNKLMKPQGKAFDFRYHIHPGQALQIAAAYGHQSILETLLPKVSFKGYDVELSQALMMAAYNEKYSAVYALIEHAETFKEKTAFYPEAVLRALASIREHLQKRPELYSAQESKNKLKTYLLEKAGSQPRFE